MKNPSLGGCRACCSGKHSEEDRCDQCPFLASGVEGATVHKLLRMGCQKHQDRDDKGKAMGPGKWYVSVENLQFAFDILGITEKERAYSYLARAVAILNGDRSPHNKDK